MGHDVGTEVLRYIDKIIIGETGTIEIKIKINEDKNN